MNWIKQNQSVLRAENYQSILDALADGIDLEEVGKKVVLPSTFIGGPRNMNQLYHDAMAIVRCRGDPDLFITVTCNPLWPEIQAAIEPGQTAEGRPDIVTYVEAYKQGCRERYIRDYEPVEVETSNPRKRPHEESDDESDDGDYRSFLHKAA